MSTDSEGWILASDMEEFQFYRDAIRIWNFNTSPNLGGLKITQTKWEWWSVIDLQAG